MVYEHKNINLTPFRQGICIALTSCGEGGGGCSEMVIAKEDRQEVGLLRIVKTRRNL